MTAPRLAALATVALLASAACQTSAPARETAAPVSTTSAHRRERPPQGLLEDAARFIELRWEAPASSTTVRLASPEGETPANLSDSVVLDVAGIDSAWVWRRPRDTTDRWSVLARLSREGAAEFGATTATHVGRRLAFIVDGRITAMPVVTSALGPRILIADGLPRSVADSLAGRTNGTVAALRPFLPVRLH